MKNPAAQQREANRRAEAKARRKASRNMNKSLTHEIASGTDHKLQRGWKRGEQA